MSKTFLLSIVLASLLLFTKTPQAMISRKPLSLWSSINQAQIIVVAQLDDFQIQKEEDDSPKQPNKYSPITTDKGFIKGKGTYKFHITKFLKGKCGVNISLNLLPIRSMFYGYNTMAIDKGGYFILMMNKKFNNLNVVEPLTPLFPIVEEKSQEIFDKPNGVHHQVVTLLLASLHKKVNVQLTTYMLRSCVDKRISGSVEPYINDTNIDIRDNVFFIMLTNGRTDAIPQLVSFSADLWKQGQSPDSLLALQDLTGVDSVHYLNKLILRKEYFLRLNSIVGLSKVADYSSIPYLLIALYDPDPQEVIPLYAYGTLYRLSPNIGNVEDAEDFYKNKDKLILNTLKWWNTSVINSTLNLSPPASTLNKENILSNNIFLGSESEKVDAVKNLPSNQETTIPLLILALNDQNNNVFISSYNRLLNLGVALKPLNSDDISRLNHNIVFNHAIQWWRNNLTVKMSPPPT